jgi:hypothetical protein
LKEERSCLPGWKFLHINTHKRAHKRASRDKSLKTLLQAEIFLYIKCKRNSSHLPGCPAKRASSVSI